MSGAFQAGDTGSNPVGDISRASDGGSENRVESDQSCTDSSLPHHHGELALPRRRPGGGKPAPALERFLVKVAYTETCWLWMGALNSSGYGVFGAGGRGNLVLAHRWAYEQKHGPIPEGLTLDHLCRRRECIRVDHLEAVSLQENIRRAAALITHCKRGHFLPLKPNRADGRRVCSACRYLREAVSP
jgi:hypothetical protein